MPRVSAATQAEHRRRLLEAAAAEFAAKGLAGTRVDDISVGAGLGKGTIYNYFSSKGEVFREVVRAWYERIAAEREDVAHDAPIGEQLLAIVRVDMKVCGEVEEFARVAMREVLMATPDEAAQLLPEWDPVDEAVLDVVRRAQDRGEIRVDRTAEELARIFRTLVTGLWFDRWLPGWVVELEDIPELSVDLYLRGVATPPAVKSP